MCEYAGGKPVCAMKVRVGMGFIFVSLHLRPTTIFERGLSCSTSVRTRKMVNYA